MPFSYFREFWNDYSTSDPVKPLGLEEIKIRAGKALSVNAKVTLGYELAQKTHSFEFKVKEVSTGEEFEVKASFNSPKLKF